MEFKRVARKVAGGFIVILPFIFAINSNAQDKDSDYVGTETCATCHEEVAKNFKSSTHGRMFIKDKESEPSCEYCHGPGKAHVEAGGGKATIARQDWKACGSCHPSEKMNFSLQYHHPVPEGRMNCSSCHDVHSASAKKPSVKEENENCVRCHQQYKGPYVFEHQAIKDDGCKVCHNPHGSMNPKMLAENDYNLCLKCHYSALQYQQIGHYAHRRALNPSQFGAKCTGCHRGVHGSNFSLELRTE